ncbi:MAG TPA: hypothetical protein ENK57_03400 [Polyangiaceae bacterium]|nr:hypothetical protein [Polyangiaceae bacterium]
MLSLRRLGVRSSGSRATVALALLTASAACTGPDGERFEGYDGLGTAQDPIVNGSPDTTHQAVVAWLKGSKCTATIVDVDVANNQGYALTAAHCVGGSLGNLRQGNNHASGQFDVQYPVVEAVIHPDYSDSGSTSDGKSSAWDFAMLRFTGANAATPSIAAITKAQDNISVGSQLDIVGYGQTENGGTTIRRHVVKPVVGLSEIMLNYDQASSGMCFGDSGGPNLYQVGNTEVVAGVNSAVQNNNCTGISRAGRVSAITSTFVEPFINGVGFGTQTCDECTAAHTQASNGDCIPELTTCFNDTDCEAWIDCRNGCTTAACVVQCDQMHPSGKALYDDVVGCLCSTCSTECAGDSFCQEPPACYLTIGPDECQTCYEGACCLEAATCAGDQDCVNCASAIFPGPSCQNVPPWVDFVTCTENSCGDVCSFSTGEVGTGGGGGMPGVGGGGPAGVGGGPAGVGGSAGLGGDPVGTGGLPTDDEVVVEGEGCGCEVAGRRSSGWGAWIALASGLVVARRRRFG